MAQTFTYVPSATCLAFHNAPLGSYDYKFIRGVPGSGKSVGCIWDVRFKSEMQPPYLVPIENKVVRWTKWLFARHSYKALLGTTVKTWTDWFPQTVIKESPQKMEGRLEVPSMHNDGSIVRIDLVFYSLDSKNFWDDLPSLEICGAYVNECPQIEWKKLHKIQERIDRYNPPGAKAQGYNGLTFGLIGDANTPTETNWYHDLEQVEKPQRMLWFIQPPAFIRATEPPPPSSKCVWVKHGKFFYVHNDEAGHRFYGTSGVCENVEHINSGWRYYEKQLVGADEDYIKRHLLNQYGNSKEGLPIYPEYSDEIHCTGDPDKVSYMPGLPLLLGMDFGRNPACVFAQMTRMGQLRVLDELTASNMSVPRFVEDLLIPKLVADFNWPRCAVVNFGDPAGMNKGEMYDLTCIQFLNQKGIPTARPETLKNNDFEVRRDAVSQFLRSNYKGVPSLLISSKCKMLRAGFNGDYCYRKVRTADGTEKYMDKADKNEYSHVQDALQYLVVGAFGGSVDYSKPGGGGESRDFSYLGTGSDFGCI